MEDCTDGDYWGTYRRFLERFISSINPEDPLPVKTNCYDVTDDELVGEVMYIALQYLDRKCCPLSLQTHIIHLVVDEVKKLCKEQPENCGWRADKKSYAPLKLMQAATGKVNEICRRYLDNSRLALLPPPYSTPLPLTSLYSIRHVRRKLEDRCTILHDLHGVFNIKDDIMASYFAIFDGHRGQAAAVYSAAHLHQYLVESENYPKNPEKALRDAILKTDEKFVEKDEELESNSGTTAVVALLMDNHMYVAWTGDSQAVLSKNNETMSLVTPHAASSDTEKERIQALGGVVIEHDHVWRVNGCISVARAIGDKQLKPFLTAEPDIVNVPLDGSEDFLILACDGFFDVVTPQEATRHLYTFLKDHHEEYREASQNLVELAKHKHSQDNISVIVVYLRAPADIAASEATRCKMSTRDEDFGFLKDDSQDICKGPLSVEANLMFPSAGLMFPKSTNGQHENGALEVDDDDEDDDDLGPETNVDTVDDATDYVPANIVINRDLFQQKLEQENGQDDMIQINDVQNDTKAPEDEKAGQNAYIVADADNVADSEDSEDEWNYYPNEEKESAGAPSAPEECQPAKQQNQTDLPEQTEFKPEGNAESFELIDTNISDNDYPEPSKPEQPDQEQRTFENLIDTDEKDDMAFNLNPNAAEFVPVATNRSPPKIAERVMVDFPISGSPLKRSNLMDDMPIPSEMEFQREVRRRPHELTHDTSYSENENENEHDNETNNELPKISMPNLCESTTEISSVKAEYGDSFFTDNTRNDGSFINDSSFTGSDKYDIAKDPMAMSLTPGDLKLALEVSEDDDDDSKHENDSENGNLLEPSVDLNAVHELRDADLGENNENLMNEWNKENRPPVVVSTEGDELMDNQANENELLNGDEAKCGLDKEETEVEKDKSEEKEVAEVSSPIVEEEVVKSVDDFQVDMEPGRITPEKMEFEGERGSPEPHSEDSTTCPIETKEQFEIDVCANDPCKTNSEDASPLDNTVPFQCMDEPLVNQSLNNVSLMLTEQMGAMNLQDTTAEFEEKEQEILKEYLVTEQKDVEEKKEEEIPQLANDFQLKPLEIDPTVPSAPFVDQKLEAPVEAPVEVAKTSPKKINKTAPAPKISTAATKTTKSLTSSAKTSAKTSPTSPTKTEKGPAARTSTSSATKKPLSSVTAKPKVLDTKPAAKPAPITKPSTAAKPLAAKTSVAAVKKVGAVTAAKPAEKKLTNGEVKSTVSKVGAAPKTATRVSGTATKTSPLVKSTATKPTAPVPKPRPVSATSTTTKTTTARTISLATSTRPKTAVTSSTTTSNVKARPLSGQSKAPMIDKQVKETANKQISSARSTASATSRTSTTATTRTSTNSTTVRRVASATTTTKTTTGATSPIKKPSVGSRVSATKTNSAASKTTSVVKTAVTKTKTLQNGDCENAQKTEIIKTTTIEEDVPKKDVSPIITPTDNQLITTEE